jgi:multidrug efflux pump subunit AcrA (membrane-fusion protein)
LLVILAVLLLGGSAAFGGWYFLARSNAARPDLILHPVKKDKLRISITERGSLEPAESEYISCKVKSKSAGAQANATSIRWVADNGAIIKKGDKILELDDSALQDQRESQQILVLQAESDWKKAEQLRAINLLTNEALVGTQKTNLEVATIALDEYVSGQYSQSRITLVNQLTMANSDLSMWEERAAWSDRMSRPGRQYVTTAQAEADSARRLSAELTKTNFETQLKVLDKLTLEKQKKTLQGAIDEAERQLKKATTQLELQRISDDVDVATKKATYDMQLSKLRDIEKEIEECFIRAPRDGMVVYYVEERARWGQTTGGVIAQGEGVKEGQKLLSVPDLSHMVVNSRVHEAMVSKVKSDMYRDTGFSEAINTTKLISTDLLSGLAAYAAFLDKRTDFSNEHRTLEKTRIARGLEAMVRVNAFPDKPLRGHVKSVATVASQNDFFASDVKVYQTFIAVDESLEGIKPGMDASITIYVDSSSEPVLILPLQGLFGSVDMGNKRYCLVKKPSGDIERREVTVGKANEREVEILEGLQEGDVVILNKELLLSDKEKADFNLVGQRGGPGGGPGWGGNGGNGFQKGGAGKQKGGGAGGFQKGGAGGWQKGGAKGGGMPGGGSPGGAPQG